VLVGGWMGRTAVVWSGLAGCLSRRNSGLVGLFMNEAWVGGWLADLNSGRMSRWADGWLGFDQWSVQRTDG